MRALLFAFYLCAMHGIGNCQGGGVLCNDGAGQFTAKFMTGVIVSVGAQRGASFSTRACEATLIWSRKVTQVARDAQQVDVDLMGADVGLGVPVVAFQIRNSAFDASRNYEIYSLQGAPQLLRTITGGDSFRVADMDMDGQVEIWTHDAKAASGFEGIPLGDFDFPPTVVLRFEDRRLIDVSSEFRAEFDHQIAQVRGQLDSKQLAEFKQSDGKLERILPAEMSEMRDLMMAKIGALEIVWAYLYSGREQEAWHALAEMWPTADYDRIRGAIAAAQARGLRSEVDGIEPPNPTPRKKKHAQVFNLAVLTKTIDPTRAGMTNLPDVHTNTANSSPLPDVVGPQSIFLYLPTPQQVEDALPRAGVTVDLVIDDAGKVNSAGLVNKDENGTIGDSVLAASAGWKFIPAMRNGRAVASHIYLTVSPFQ